MKFLGFEIRRASDGIKTDTQLPNDSRKAESLLFYPNMSRAELMKLFGMNENSINYMIRPSAEECVRNGRAKCTKMRWAIRSNLE